MNFYRSGFEGQIAEDLHTRGVPFDYEPEKLKYQTTVRGGQCPECGCKRVKKARVYTPDFVLKNGRGKLYVEAKGRFVPSDRSKMLDVRRSNPELDIRLLFQKSSKPAMAKLQAWCDKNKFVCAFGHEVPEEWLL